jgi:hypothetical protein
MMKYFKAVIFTLFLCLSVCSISTPVWAHSFDITDAMELGDTLWYEHADAQDFKGWLNLTVTNSGNAAWGDFHFEIFEVSSLFPVDNVHFDVSTPNEPASSQGGLTWVLDNNAIGATLDLYFYGDPVLPGETATFSVYTDNTADQLEFFGTAFYPTPVPVPAAVWLLGSGLIGVLGLRERFTA